LVQPALQTAAARVTLSPKEQAAFKALTRPDDKKAEWLFGRFAAKDAMRMLMRQMTGERPFMADIEIESDQRGRPIASPRGTLRPDDYPNVSIAHTAGLVAAIAADAPHVGIDVERVVPRDAGFLKIAFSEDERRMLDMHGDDLDEAIARFWCAKEAVGKALGCGLGGAPQNLAVVYEQPPPGKVDERVGPERAADDPPSGRVDVRLGPELAAELPDWADADLIVTTRRDGPYVVATTLCERAGR
jgi:phosphopantetheinyl transferase (holo-ACP synthase)